LLSQESEVHPRTFPRKELNMVDKTSKQGRKYAIDGRRLIWHPEDDDGNQGTMPDVTIPLRIKMRAILELAEVELDTVGMRRMLAMIVPESQFERIDDMDVNDFQDMFTTWQSEYSTLTGGSLGESSASPVSPPSIEPPSSSTSEPVSASV
jgi:hypothetical protein